MLVMYCKIMMYLDNVGSTLSCNRGNLNWKTSRKAFTSLHIFLGGSVETKVHKRDFCLMINKLNRRLSHLLKESLELDGLTLNLLDSRIIGPKSA